MILIHMYSVFPYTSEDHSRFKGQLNQFTGDQVKEALDKNIKLAKNIIHDACLNSFLKTELLSFIDQIIQSEVELQENPGDRIAEKIDSIYSQEITLTADELEKANDADSWIEGTMPPDVTQAYIKKTRAASAKELIDLDDKSKTFEKAMFLGLFNDITRLEWSKDPSNLKLKDLKTRDGEWSYLADSFRGGHTLAVNSDAYKVPKYSKHLLAVMSDGVTYSYPHEVSRSQSNDDLYKNPHSEVHKRNMGLFGGTNLAQVLTNKISSFPFEAFIDKNHRAVHMDDLTNSQDDTRIDIASDVIKFFADLHADGFNFERDSDENFFTQCKKFLVEQGENDKAAALDESKLRLTITALAPFYALQESLIPELQNRYAGVDLLKTLAATLNYAVEIDDKIITVNIADSDIACYNAEGKKLETTSSVRQRPRTNNKMVVDGLDVYHQDHICLHLQKNNQPNHASIPPLAGSDKDNFRVNIYDKKDVAKVVLSSDGCLDKSKKLPDETNTDSKQAYIDLISFQNNDHDDRTAIVLEKVS